MKKTKPTAIIIAEDHPLYRKALCDLVRGNPDFDVVAETGDGRMVEALVEQFKPGILLLDLNLPGMSGLEIAQHLRDRHPEVKIVVLTMNNDEAVFNSVIDAGVSGYVLKESAVDIILECMRAVVGGDHYISPSLAHHLV
ncbi:MAG TPA: response regulator transcription factor, partial [Bacteroidota bacterium]|nr:response regulator transcription factor [Bacteroidota bacterium]